jgi:hypothetical protein
MHETGDFLFLELYETEMMLKGLVFSLIAGGSSFLLFNCDI